MKRKLTRGSTGVVVPVLLQDTSRTDGSGLTGVTYNSPGLTARWKRSDQTDWQPLTLVAGVVGTWVGSATTAGFVPLPSGRGACELSLPNEALAAGTWVIVQLYGAASMADINLEIELDAVNYQDAMRFGLAALLNAAAGTSDGLPTADAVKDAVLAGLCRDGRTVEEHLYAAGTAQAGDTAYDPETRRFRVFRIGDPDTVALETTSGQYGTRSGTQIDP